METLEEYLIGLEQDKRAEHLRDNYPLDYLLDEDTKDEIKEFAISELLKKGISQSEIDKWGYEEFDEAFDEIKEFTIQKILEKELDIKYWGWNY